MRRTLLWLLPCLVLTASACPTWGQQPPATVDPGGQVARFLRSDMAAMVKAAPPAPALPADLKLQLVDYIDCTDAKDIHPLLHDGLGRIAASSTGSYRETGPAANSYFAYRFRVAAPGRAHVVVMQFPDDADRIAAIALAQPPTGDTSKPAARMEFGYRTGDLLGLSGTMVTRWTFFWPTSEAPPALVVANWHARSPAALARVWVYAVADERLPEAGSSRLTFYRHGGRYDASPAAVFTRFGGRTENLVQTMDYLGMDEVAMNALEERTFNYPSARFSTGSEAVPETLPVLAEGKKRLIAVFDPDCTVGTFSMPGLKENMADIGVANVAKVWQEFIDWDFLKPFGKSAATGGLMFGGPRGCAAFDLKADNRYTSFLQNIAKTLGRNYSRLRVYQNLAAASPRTHYFQRPGADWPVLGRWELSEKSLDRCIAEEVLDYWRSYGLVPEELAATDQLMLMRQCDRDDSAAYRFGHNAVPRYWLLDTIASSRAVTDLVTEAKIHGLVLSSTPASRMVLLQPDDFWWPYPEMSPTITPGGDGFFTLAAQAMAAGLEPYTVWLAGTGSAAALHEDEVRRWMTVLRRLPFRSFTPVEGASQYPVAVRAYVYRSSRYVLLANTAPVGATVTVTFSAETSVAGLGRPIKGKLKAVTLALPPGGIEAFYVGEAVGIEGVTQESPALEPMLAARLERYAADLDAATQAGIALAPRYGEVLKDARAAMAKTDLGLVDRLLNVGVVREPGFRLRVATARPKAAVGRAPQITVDGQLADWQGIEPIRLGAIQHLVCSPHVANHWQGTSDLSAELHLAWSEAGLHFALRVTDDRPTTDENESSLLALSASAYRSHSSRAGFDALLHLPRRENLTSDNLVTARDGGVTIHEGLIPAAELGPQLAPRAGRTVGFNLIVSDSDDRAGMPYAWCRSNVLAWSNRQDGYHYGSDAQTCGEISFR